MKNALIAAFAAATLFAGAANAALINGTFTVTAYNVTNLNSAESQATAANFAAAGAGTLGGGAADGSVISTDTFTYTGDLAFSTSVGSSTQIDEWLATGGGTLTGLDTTFGDLQQSKGSISSTPGSATSTFYLFELVAPLGATDFRIIHDDGIAVYDGVIAEANLVGGNVGPTSEKTTDVFGYGGPDFTLLYVATNSDPSILNVSAIPLPAGLPLLAAGLGGLMVLRRRRAKS